MAMHNCTCIWCATLRTQALDCVHACCMCDSILHMLLSEPHACSMQPSHLDASNFPSSSFVTKPITPLAACIALRGHTVSGLLCPSTRRWGSSRDTVPSLHPMYVSDLAPAEPSSRAEKRAMEAAKYFGHDASFCSYTTFKEGVLVTHFHDHEALASSTEPVQVRTWIHPLIYPPPLHTVSGAECQGTATVARLEAMNKSVGEGREVTGRLAGLSMRSYVQRVMVCVRLCLCDKVYELGNSPVRGGCDAGSILSELSHAPDTAPARYNDYGCLN